MTELPPIRRIVTGHNPDGQAVILENGALPHVTRPEAQPGLAFHEVWSTDQMPMPLGFECPDPTERHRVTAPPANGTVIRFVDIPPEGPSGIDDDKDRLKELFEAVGLGENTEHAAPGRHPLMHRTQSVDYGIVISGELTLMLDEEELALREGDVVVQRGTIHAWANRSDTICRMLFVLTDAVLTPELAAAQAAQDARVKVSDVPAPGSK